VVLAIAIGLSGCLAVLSAYAILTRELDKGFLATNPASAALHTDAINDALLSAVLADPEVGQAQARRLLFGQVRTGPAQWRDLTLIVVKDYANISVNKFVPELGTWPPRIGEVLIERDAFKVAHAKAGDTLTIRLNHGKDQTLRVAGGVHDVGQAQARMENIVYGYITLDTVVSLGEQPYLDQLDIVVAENRLDEQHIRDVAQHIKAIFETHGHPVRGVDIPRPGKHVHADIMGVLLTAMSIFGFLILILSGVVVVNLLSGMMASQVRQIGVMKAIGGTRRQIAIIYFSQAVMLGVAALFIALPVGILGGRFMSRSFGALLNFDITSFTVPLWVYLLIVSAALFVPLLAAAYPVWKGSAISVREALAYFGVSARTFGTSGFDRMLAGLGGASRPLLFAIRNSFRRRARLALTLATLATAGMFFMSAMNIHSSMVSTLDRLFASMKYDLMVSYEGSYPDARIAHALNNTPGILRSENWFTTMGVLSPHPGDGRWGGTTLEGEGFSIRALPPKTNMIDLQIVEGRNLLPNDLDAIVVNSAMTSTAPEMKVGNTVSFRIGQQQTSWHVVGVAREFFTPPTAYVPQAFADRLQPGMRTRTLLALAKSDPASINSFKTNLEHSLQQDDVRISASTSKADIRYGRDEHLLMIYVLLVLMSGIVMVVGGLGLATTMSLNVMERRREMGVLRAIGATSSTIWLIIVSEGAVIGVISWALAALAAWPISKSLGDALTRTILSTHLDFSFQYHGLFIWLFISVLFSAVASFLPAWSASKLTVREALAYE
jgi:putative ABC transport system permease protein